MEPEAVATLAGREFGGEVVVDWTTALDDRAGEPVTHFGYGWATQVVDPRRRRVGSSGSWLPTTSGAALNPTLLEGQIEGGVHMGLGQALSEEWVTDGGVPVTDTLKSLGIIPAAGMPPVECILVEEPQPEGPYGAKGMGEAVLVPTAAAVAGALYRFDGIRRTTLPMRDSAAALAAVPRRAGIARATGTVRAREPAGAVPR